ncbi:hypothetical protein POVWA2_001100 [Plasmodium ovale wallikeri]|uniref:Uncharacterized protein n=2 Tax=Plasmodium ovale TaxID=36330 RepID=A0A1A8YFV4_PLAOA|nr:hypothetical protein POVWA1_000830 [Plasmodium ovale wallikeri]SBT30868.1 hypothetical protein POVWA2_001100 [Plasmodium ovale wallikeri]SBT75171.1 conserved Plasmodium protein, unknown function [Plasmodium ovale]
MSGILLKSLHLHRCSGGNDSGRCYKNVLNMNMIEGLLATGRRGAVSTLRIPQKVDTLIGRGYYITDGGYANGPVVPTKYVHPVAVKMSTASTSSASKMKKGQCKSAENKEDGSNNSRNELNEANNSSNSYVNKNDFDDFVMSEKEGKKKRSKMKIAGYAFTLIFGSYVVYKVYQNDMNLSKAEESIVKDFVNLMYTYEEKMSIQNSKFVTCLSENLNRQIAMYFLQLDTDKNSGFLISDALNFLAELNIKEDNAIVKNFIKNGTGKNIELKKLSGCSLQQFAELIESLILANKTTNENILSSDKLFSAQNKENYYMDTLQQYINKVVDFVKTTNLYLYYQMKTSNSSESEEKLDDLEILILDKLSKYNEKYVDKKNLSLDYLLSKEELNKLRKNNVSKMDEEKELLLIEKKKIEEKIQMLFNLQQKKTLTETEIKRLQDLKIKLRNIKYTIKKEELKKYFL